VNRVGVRTLLVGTIMLAGPLTAWPQNVRDREEIVRILTVEKITVADGVISGEVLNRSANTLRDVQLFICYTWLWDS
jgi:cation transporter-like permease